MEVQHHTALEGEATGGLVDPPPVPPEAQQNPMPQDETAAATDATQGIDRMQLAKSIKVSAKTCRRVCFPPYLQSRLVS